MCFAINWLRCFQSIRDTIYGYSFRSNSLHILLLTFPVAEQYDETEYRIKTLKSGEDVVTSRELTITLIYNAYYWSVPGPIQHVLLYTDQYTNITGVRMLGQCSPTQPPL